MTHILGVDIGTTGLKMGVFRKAEFRGLTAETSREELLAALIRGLCHYQREHLNEIGRRVKLKDRVHITGGALNPAIIRAKKKWMRAGEYNGVRFHPQLDNKTKRHRHHPGDQFRAFRGKVAIKSGFLCMGQNLVEVLGLVMMQNYG
jgi:hypothetical protein